MWQRWISYEGSISHYSQLAGFDYSLDSEYKEKKKSRVDFIFV
jgi:hypothetical protein